MSKVGGVRVRFLRRVHHGRRRPLPVGPGCPGI